VAVGGDLLEPMAGVNAEGFWEDGRIVALNERLLAVDGLRWYDCTDAIGDAAANPLKRTIRAEAVTYVKSHYAIHDIAVMKDPRMCRLLLFWFDVYAECGMAPYVLHVLRHPFAVAKSLRRRDGLPYEYSILLWLVYTLEAIAHAAKQPTLLICFDRALQEPAGIAKVLEENLELGPAEERLQRLSAAGGVFKPELRREDRQLDAELGATKLVQLALAVHAALLEFDGRAVRVERLDDLLQRYRDLRVELAADIAMLRRLAGESLAASAETVRIGGLHSDALRIIAERDVEIADRNQLIDDLKNFRIRRLIPRIIERK
jgi:hypothetical protein